MKKVLLLFVALIMLSSCSLLFSSGSASSRLTERARLDLEIFQTLDENTALALTNDYKVVQIKSYEAILYDGKTLSDTFILIDTYTYQTKDETTKTVPVYMKSGEYYRIMRGGK